MLESGMIKKWENGEWSNRMQETAASLNAVLGGVIAVKLDTDTVFNWQYLKSLLADLAQSHPKVVIKLFYTFGFDANPLHTEMIKEILCQFYMHPCFLTWVKSLISGYLDASLVTNKEITAMAQLSWLKELCLKQIGYLPMPLVTEVN